jgi:hypothetical protein
MQNRVSLEYILYKVGKIYRKAYLQSRLFKVCSRCFKQLVRTIGSWNEEMGIEEKRMGIEVGEVGEEACVFGG